MTWRPEGWRDHYFKWQDNRKENGVSIFNARANFEAGADAMLEAIWKMAEKSPTNSFTFDTNAIQIYCHLTENKVPVSNGDGVTPLSS